MGKNWGEKMQLTWTFDEGSLALSIRKRVAAAYWKKKKTLKDKYDRYRYLKVVTSYLGLSISVLLFMYSLMKKFLKGSYMLQANVC